MCLTPLIRSLKFYGPMEAVLTGFHRGDAFIAINHAFNIFDHLITESSHILDRRDVRAIGLKLSSSARGWHFGTGAMEESFKSEGKIPMEKETLKMLIIG